MPHHVQKGSPTPRGNPVSAHLKGLTTPRFRPRHPAPNSSHQDCGSHLLPRLPVPVLDLLGSRASSTRSTPNKSDPTKTQVSSHPSSARSPPTVCLTQSRSRSPHQGLSLNLSSHSLLAVPRMLQGHTCLRAFAHTLPLLGSLLSQIPTGGGLPPHLPQFFGQISPPL